MKSNRLDATLNKELTNGILVVDGDKTYSITRDLRGRQYEDFYEVKYSIFSCTIVTGRIHSWPETSKITWCDIDDTTGNRRWGMRRRSSNRLDAVLSAAINSGIWS